MLVFNFRKLLVKSASLQWIVQYAACQIVMSVIVGCLLLFGNRTLWAEQSPPVVTASPWRPEMRVGGPIAIELRIQNQSASDLTINLGDDEKEGIQILATSASGQSYSGSWRSKEGLSLNGKIKIAAASETERILTLEDWNISPLPGKYNVLISFKYGAFVGTGPELYLAPVNIKI